MMTAVIAGVLLLLLGAILKGLFAHAMVFFVAWLAKNGLLLAFLRTRIGRRMVRNVRFKTYTQIGSGPGRRRAYRVFRHMAGAEHATITGLRRIRNAVMRGGQRLGIKISH
ncbi:hypothetical protein [Magnetospirillum sp. UT-4]|uniref:hypothetical protein n=1 Tax=Magnetospirillum sp. UT-4 TaxID=2681467 RepID=UPI0013820B82|nr:hypothetical protein [Magnetospirillum sp. UT-4]CAA7626816.1 conserved exported hypothetical protein [Magnetospirillum sp. UT-4]